MDIEQGTVQTNNICYGLQTNQNCNLFNRLLENICYVRVVTRLPRARKTRPRKAV